MAFTRFPYGTFGVLDFNANPGAPGAETEFMNMPAPWEMGYNNYEYPGEASLWDRYGSDWPPPHAQWGGSERNGNGEERFGYNNPYDDGWHGHWYAPHGGQYGTLREPRRSASTTYFTGAPLRDQYYLDGNDYGPRDNMFARGGAARLWRTGGVPAWYNDELNQDQEYMQYDGGYGAYY